MLCSVDYSQPGSYEYRSRNSESGRCRIQLAVTLLDPNTKSLTKWVACRAGMAHLAPMVSTSGHAQQRMRPQLLGEQPEVLARFVDPKIAEPGVARLTTPSRSIS